VAAGTRWRGILFVATVAACVSAAILSACSGDADTAGTALTTTSAPSPARAVPTTPSRTTLAAASILNPGMHAAPGLRPITVEPFEVAADGAVVAATRTAPGKGQGYVADDNFTDAAAAYPNGASVCCPPRLDQFKVQYLARLQFRAAPAWTLPQPRGPGTV